MKNLLFIDNFGTERGRKRVNQPHNGATMSFIFMQAKLFFNVDFVFTKHYTQDTYTSSV